MHTLVSSDQPRKSIKALCKFTFAKPLGDRCNNIFNKLGRNQTGKHRVTLTLVPKAQRQKV